MTTAQEPGSAAVACPRCGRDIPIVLGVAGHGEASATMLDHACDRFLVAHLVGPSGDNLARWTSDDPGRSGPYDLVEHHGAQVGTSLRAPGGTWLFEWMVAAPGRRSS